MELEGYKVLTKKLQNKDGKIFLPGEVYETKNSVHFGTEGHGFHFSIQFEDAFKYLESFTREFSLTKIKAGGEISQTYDKYHGGEKIYACSKIEILSILKEEEIMSLALLLPPKRVMRFLQLYPLTEEEKNLFKEFYPHQTKEVQMIFDYYQEGKKDAFLFPNRYKNMAEEEIKGRRR